MKFLVGLALALAAASVPAPAHAQARDEATQNAWVLERGRLIFALDRAAWVATDDMLARIPDPVAAGLVGYIVDRDGDRFIAIFFAEESGRLVAAYRAGIGPRGVVDPQAFPRGSRPALTPLQQRLARTGQWAQRNGGRLQRCSPQSFNLAIIPPTAADGPIDLYFLTPQLESGFPFGGHHRVTLDAGGNEVARRSFARSCLTMPPPPRNAAGIMVSHLLDPTPTEIHVFNAMAAQRPVYVSIGGNRLFEVTGARIRVVQMPGARQ